MNKFLDVFFGLLSIFMLVGVGVNFALNPFAQQQKTVLLLLLPMTLVEAAFVWLVVYWQSSKQQPAQVNILYLGSSLAMIVFFVGALVTRALAGAIFMWACLSLVATNSLAVCLTRYRRGNTPDGDYKETK